MTKDITTAVFIFFCVKASKIVDMLGYGETEQIFAYKMGFVLTFLALMIFILTEVKGNRVYLWMFGVVTAAMNPINLMFNGMKLEFIHGAIFYAAAAGIVFWYKRSKFKVR